MKQLPHPVIGLMALVNHGSSQEENSQRTISYHNIERYATGCWPLAKVIMDKQGACLRICALEDWDAVFGLLKVPLTYYVRIFNSRKVDIYKDLHSSEQQQYIAQLLEDLFMCIYAFVRVHAPLHVRI